MKTSKRYIFITLLVIFLFCFSGYEFYLLKEQQKQIDRMNIIIDDSKNKIDDLETSIDDAKSEIEKHKRRIVSLEDDIEGIYQWSGQVVQWSRQF